MSQNKSFEAIYLINKLNSWTNTVLDKLVEGDEEISAKFLSKVVATIEDPTTIDKLKNLMSDLGVPF
jgi:hypothetical protein